MNKPNINKIVNEWFYRLPNGYAESPYTEKELEVLDVVLTENGLDRKNIQPIIVEAEDAEEIEKPAGYTDEEWLDILKDIHGRTQIEQFDQLAAASMKMAPVWAKELGFIDGEGKVIWSPPDHSEHVKAWTYYYDKYLGAIKAKDKDWKEPRNIGERVEVAVVQWANEILKYDGAKVLRGKGTDVTIISTDIEVKSDETKKINNQLQTAFPKDDPEVWYIFVSHTQKPNQVVRLVNSQLLRRALLGEELYDTITGNEKIQARIDKIIDEEFAIKKLLKDAILNPTDVKETTKSFDIGPGIAVRFQVLFVIKSIRALEDKAKKGLKK